MLLLNLMNSRIIIFKSQGAKNDHQNTVHCLLMWN